MNDWKTQFPPLNLPLPKLSIWQDQGVWWVKDVFRKKAIQLTPEEWVRQHILHYFVSELQYPTSLLSIERIVASAQRQRYDAAWYLPKGDCFMLIECKAPTIAIDQKTMLQAGNYAKEKKARHVVLSNGFKHLAFKTGQEQSAPELLSSIPAFPKI